MCGLFGALMRPLELTAAIEEDEEGKNKKHSNILTHYWDSPSLKRPNF